jgi:hypothetical protein
MAAEISDAKNLAEYLTAAAEWIECRAFGHAWKSKHRGWIEEGAGRHITHTKTLGCMRCPLTRVDTLDRSFSLISRDYQYPDGYLTRGIDVSRHEVRKWDVTHSATVTPVRRGARRAS